MMPEESIVRSLASLKDNTDEGLRRKVQGLFKALSLSQHVHSGKNICLKNMKSP